LSIALLCLTLVTAVAACTSTSEEQPSAAPPSSTEAPVRPEPQPADDGDDGGDTRARALRLVEDLGTSDLGESIGGAASTDDSDPLADPALEDCAVDYVLDHPELLDIDFDTLEPSDPAAPLVFEMVFACVPRETFIALFTDELVGVAPPETVTCIEDVMMAMTDDELAAFFLGAANEDDAVIEGALGSCIDS
jgi:hypothetical protein